MTCFTEDRMFWAAQGFLLLLSFAFFGGFLIGRQSSRRNRASLERARGAALTRLAQNYGFERKRIWWCFRESDRSLRRRIAECIVGRAR